MAKKQRPNKEETFFEEKVKRFAGMLRTSHNIILHGAPGTGKTYFAKHIAAEIVSGDNNDEAPPEDPKKQIGFVQFHPSYDYTDFVEGLRPVKSTSTKPSGDGKTTVSTTTVDFELQDGVFKEFVDIAKNNYNISLQKEDSIELRAIAVIKDYFRDNQKPRLQAFGRGNKKDPNKKTGFYFTTILNGEEDFESDRTLISCPRIEVEDVEDGEEVDTQSIDEEEVDIQSIHSRYVKCALVAAIQDPMINIQRPSELTEVLLKRGVKSGSLQPERAYLTPICEEIIKYYRENVGKYQKTIKQALKYYVFIIDEINRGEISKIFGELFFAIDPSYRVKKNEDIEGCSVFTQYANMHEDNDEKFYIPDNVYIIGTMNDIDRSVDSFDFAMRRRFRFIELKANECTEMLDSLDDSIKDKAINRMKNLNKVIAEQPGLGTSYQIGASYFLNFLKGIEEEQKNLNNNNLNKKGKKNTKKEEKARLKELRKLTENSWKRAFDDLWSDYLEPLLREYVRGMGNEDKIIEAFENAYNNDKPVQTSNEATQE